MAGKRKVHTPPFKAQVALAALKGDRTVNELAGQYDVHPTLIHAWKKQLLDRGRGALRGGRPRRPRTTPRPARPSCSSRSAGSRWSWSGSKKKLPSSCEHKRSLIDVGPPGLERPPPVRAARPVPVEPLLRAGRRDAREPAADAADRRAVHRPPVLRQPADDPVADRARGGGEPQASAAADADHGPGGDLPEAPD